MTHFIRDNTSPGDAKADYRVLSEVPSSQKITAADWNTYRQAMLDVQSFLRGADWLAVAAQSAVPAPSGVSNFLWLDNAGLIHLTQGGSDRVVAGSPLSPPWAAGRYYFAPNQPGTGAITTLGVGTLRAIPFYVPNTVTITKIGADIAAAGEAGSKFRLGIYADDGTGRPGTLVVDAGQIAGDSATVQEVTIGSPPTIAAGWYWAAGVVQSVVTTQPSVRIHGNAFPQIDGGSSIPSANTQFAGLQMMGVTGALPATFTVAGSVSTAPRIFVKT